MWDKVLINIKDLDFYKVPTLGTRAVVAYSKHLCGCATDFTLRCLLDNEEGERCKTFIVALCCHHKCTWASYISMFNDVTHVRSIFYYFFRLYP